MKQYLKEAGFTLMSFPKPSNEELHNLITKQNIVQWLVDKLIDYIDYMSGILANEMFISLLPTSYVSNAVQIHVIEVCS